MKPLVSIIIATYNRKDLLKIALESALEQDYENIEIIVTDNASIDGTDIFMQSYLEKYDNIIYIRREENIGPFYNGYKAYSEVSKGKYIFFLCDDDYMMSNTFIKNAVSIMESYQNVVLVTGHVQMYFEDINKYLTIPYNEDKLVSGIDYLINQSTVTMQNKYPEIIALFFLIRRECLEKNPFFHSFKESNDVAIRFYTPILGDIYFLHEFVGCYRLHTSNRETSNFNTLKNDCICTIKFIDDIVQKYIEVYPQYKEFWCDYIPLKISDAYIRDRIIKSFGDKAPKKEIKRFLNNIELKKLNPKVYKYIYNLFIKNDSRIAISPFSYEYVAGQYFYLAIFRAVFSNFDSALFGFVKSNHELRIWFLFFSLRIKLKNKYHSKLPKLYAYANNNIPKNSQIEAYYTLDKSKANQISSYDNIMELISNSDISKGEPITKTNTTKVKEINRK